MTKPTRHILLLAALLFWSGVIALACLQCCAGSRSAQEVRKDVSRPRPIVTDDTWAYGNARVGEHVTRNADQTISRSVNK